MTLFLKSPILPTLLLLLLLTIPTLPTLSLRSPPLLSFSLSSTKLLLGGVETGDKEHRLGQRQGGRGKGVRRNT